MQIDHSAQSSGDSRTERNEDVRRRVHAMWSAVAGAWDEHADYVDDRSAGLTARLIDLMAPAPGEAVLELACGVGGPGLEVAERVGPAGRVVLSDVSSEMTSFAIARAAARGLSNVSGHPLDLEAIDESDASYDVVFCREGLMFAVDPGQALREVNRVLKPGGRVALSVWGERARNPWLGLVFDAASEVLGRPVPPDGIPGPFALAESGRLAAVFAETNLVDVKLEEIVVDSGAPSFEAFWDRTRALAGPLTKILSALPPAGVEAVKRKVQHSLSPYEHSGGLSIPGIAIIAAARKLAG